MTTPYLSVAGFRVRTIMPQADVDQLEITDPGFLDACLTDWSDAINTRLRKRYVVPFVSPVPPIILRWLTKLVTRDAYDKRGNNPSAASDAEAIYKAAERAEAELKEAADSKDGLFDLPVRDDAQGQSGVKFGGPLGYSEQSPYVWADRQREDAEDGSTIDNPRVS